MQVILAIVADQQQAAQLAALIGGRLAVDLVQAAEVGEGLLALDDRIPDLILTSPLMSPFDDGVLDEYLRELGPAGAHVQTLRIPVLSQAPKKAPRLGFSLRRRSKPQATTPDGCEPKVFADEIAHYLERAAEEKRHAATTDAAAVIERHVAHDDPVPQPIDEEDWTPAYGSDVVTETAGVLAKEPEPDSSAWRSDLLDRAPVEDAPGYDQGEVEAVSEWQEDGVEKVRLKPDTTFEQVRLQSDTTLEQVASEPDTTSEQIWLEPDTTLEPIVSEPDTASEQGWLEPDTTVLVESFEEPPVVEQALVNPTEFQQIAAVTERAVEEAHSLEQPDVNRPVAPSPVVTNSAITARPAPAVREHDANSDKATPSFKAALAAIRAAWGKPASRASSPASTQEASAATSLEMDPTGAVERLGEATIELEKPSDASVSHSFAVADSPEAPDVYELSVETDTTEVALSLPEPSGDTRKKPAKRARKAVKAKGPRPTQPTAVQDEWGMFDPDRCGFAAVGDKLDEVSNEKAKQPHQGGKSRVLSCS
jgi:hypothetical protein